MSRRVPWFLPHHPDVLGLIRRQADVTYEGIAAFARWSAGGSDEDAQAVRDAEHEADDTRHELLQALTIALTTPIEQEDAYALSERMDEVIDSAKDTVRIAQALGWAPDAHAAAMGKRAEESAGHMRDAIHTLIEKNGHPGETADLVMKTARRMEHDLLAGLAELPRDGDSFTRAAALEVYRSYSELSMALGRVGDRTWYAVLKVI
jgi:uncharacterized protein Yka (UPF0111/DUF47 family)